MVATKEEIIMFNWYKNKATPLPFIYRTENSEFRIPLGKIEGKNDELLQV